MYILLPIFYLVLLYLGTRDQTNCTKSNSFESAINDHKIVSDLFENVSFSKDLAVTSKHYNQIKTSTVVDKILRLLKSVVVNGWPESKGD